MSVLIGTIAALFYRTNDVIIYANWNILGRKPWKTYRRWIQNLLVMICSVAFINRILPDIGNYFSWILNAVWVSVVCGTVYFCIDSICDMESFIFIKNVGVGLIQKRKVK